RARRKALSRPFLGNQSLPEADAFRRGHPTMVDRITRRSGATLLSPASSRQGTDVPHFVSSTSSATAPESVRIAAGQLQQYLSARVDSAVDHLDGRLHADDLQFVKD